MTIQGLAGNGVQSETVSDEVWGEILAILGDCDPPKPTGRRRIGQRQALDGIVYRLRHDCGWSKLPRRFGDDSSVHRTYQRWQRTGAWRRIAEQLKAAGVDLPESPRADGLRRTASQISADAVI
jgi:transposase